MHPQCRAVTLFVCRGLCSRAELTVAWDGLARSFFPVVSSTASAFDRVGVQICILYSFIYALKVYVNDLCLTRASPLFNFCVISI